MRELNTGEISIAEQASLLPEPQRAAWIASACDGDPQKIAQVERCLQLARGFDQRPEVAWDSSADVLVDEPTEQVASSTEADEAGSEKRAQLGRVAQPGSVIAGRYQLLRSLGQGGMGQVWLAHRYQEFEQVVAIKFLHLGMDAQATQRFSKEREILARLEHPHIARIIDGGSEQGLLWYSMEFIEGQQLDLWIKQKRPTLRDRIALMIRLASAVQYAHSQLIVHRDLKPGNVIVQSKDLPKLVDFGIAKVLNDAQSDLTLNMTPMSIAYGAPEQVRGVGISTATDVYSLGVMLFELLSGVNPHRAQSQTQDSMALLITIMETELKPPSRFASDSAACPAAQLRGDLDTITMKAMARAPAQRYTSAQAFADDLQRYLDGAPILARAPSFRYRAGKFIQRNRVASAITLIALTGILGLSGYALRLAHSNALARQSAELQAERAEQTVRFMTQIFGGANVEENEGAQVSAQTLLDRGVRSLDALSSLDPSTRVDMLIAMSKSYGSMGNAALMLETAQRSFDLSQALSSADRDDQSLLQLRAKVALNSALNRNSRFQESLTLIDAAQTQYDSLIANVATRQRQFDPDQLLLAQIAHHKAIALNALNQLKDGLRFAEQAYTIRLKKFGLADSQVIESLPVFVILLRANAQQARAMKISEDNYRASLKKTDLTLKSQLWIRDAYRRGLTATQQFQASAKIAEEMVQLAKQLYGPDSVRVAVTYDAYAAQLGELGETKQALAQVQRALAIYQTTPSPTHELFARTNAGKWLGRDRQFALAKIELERAIQIAESTARSDTENAYDARLELAYVLAMTENGFRDQQIAERLSKRALTWKSQQPSNAFSDGEYAIRHVETLLQIGKKSDACAMLQKDVRPISELQTQMQQALLKRCEG